MRVWTIKIGEPLPIEECNSRLYRTGLVSSTLAKMGHSVTWWTSTFYHQEKRHLFTQDTVIPISENFKVKSLHTTGYKSNISVGRIIDHTVMSRKFAKLARLEQPPDLILCAFPTIQLLSAVVDYGKLLNIPTVIDIRDLWPDVFLHILPHKLRRYGSIPLRTIHSKVGYYLKQATALTAMSEGCLTWGLKHAGRKKTNWDKVFPLGYPDLNVDDESVAEAAIFLRNKGVDPAKTICWFLGMFGMHYDIPTVIHAAGELERRQSKSIQFVLSGDGPEMVKWQRMARGLTNIIFTGRIGPAAIAYMNKIAAVGLLAGDSVPESLPNKLFEYLAAGLPVVSSLPGDTENFIRKANCGVTYAPNDPAAFLKALEPLIVNPELRRQMGVHSLHTYKSGYSADIVYKKMATHLENIASGTTF